jgi:hypothetical protein
VVNPRIQGDRWCWGNTLADWAGGASSTEMAADAGNAIETISTSHYLPSSVGISILNLPHLLTGLSVAPSRAVARINDLLTETRHVASQSEEPYWRRVKCRRGFRPSKSTMITTMNRIQKISSPPRAYNLLHSSFFILHLLQSSCPPLNPLK